jgi:antitoxin component YwqK of YwqJK toxin-antitoxin module
MESEVSYRDGKRNGVERKWYENGQIASQRYFLDNKPTGLARGWLENGNHQYHYQH